MKKDNECPSCGSTLADRNDYRRRNEADGLSTKLKRCPHCGSEKCCMCDMGDDVECPSCGGGDLS